MKKNQVLSALAVLVITLVVGFTTLDSAGLVFRLIIGLTFGYALGRGAFGFAGCINRACRAGSTRLIRAIMLLFFMSATMTAILLFSGSVTTETLWIKPINFGLILGGTLFGVGMAFASCCATGVLTDLTLSPSRALIVMLFFGIGVFIGLPVANGGYDWINKSWIKVGDFNGVYLPDLFNGKFDGLLGAVLLVGLLALIVSYISVLVEYRLKSEGKYKGVAAEVAYKEVEVDEMPKNLFTEDGYKFFFGNPWSAKTTAVVLTAGFTALMVVTKVGWGASTIYGLWFGKLLTLVGVDAASVGEFAKMGDGAAFVNVFSNPVSVQNIGIALGTLVAILSMGRFTPSFKITLKELVIFAIGGLLLGFGTRLSKGCNVGALYTPIANLSLSGWFFFIFMTIGGFVGNRIYKKVL